MGSAAKHWGEIRATDAAAYEGRLFDKSNTASKMWADIAFGSFEPGNKKVVGRKKARPTAYRPITLGHFWQRYIELGWTGSARAKKPIPTASYTAHQLDADLREFIRTDNNRSKHVVSDEMTIMAIKKPKAFCAALAAPLPGPSKRRPHLREYQDSCTSGSFWKLAPYFTRPGPTFVHFANEDR